MFPLARTTAVAALAGAAAMLAFLGLGQLLVPAASPTLMAVLAVAVAGLAGIFGARVAQQAAREPQARLEAENARLQREMSEHRTATLALRESEQRIRSIVNTAVEAIITTNSAGVISSFNPAAERIFGYTANEALGRDVTLLMPEVMREAHAGYMENYLAGSKPRIIGVGGRHVTGRRKDGSRVELELAISEFNVGSERYFTGMLHDVSERVDTESALRESEQRLRRMVEHLPAGALYVEKGAIHANRAVEALTGYPRDRLRTLDDWFELMFGVRGDEARSLYEADREGGFPHIRTLPIQRRDGQQRLLEVTGYRFEHGEVWLLHDVTERRRTEEALRESEERFRNLIEGSLQGIYIHREWKPVFANQAYADIMGFDSPAEILALDSLEGRFAPRDRERVRAHAEALRKGERPGGPLEFQGVRRDGTVVDLVKVARLINWNGRPAVQCTVVDVTERRRAENAAKRHQSALAHASRLGTMGEMATALAHELSQPLTAIVSYAEGAARRLRSGGEPHGELVGVLDETAALAKRAGGIIRGLRDFVRKRAPEPRRVNVNDVVIEAVRLVGAEMRRRGIRLTTALGSDMPEIWADFIQLEQIVLNLLRNGIEAMDGMPETERLLTVRTFARGTREVQISVCDAGPGLDPEIRDHLFEPFVSTRPEGLGLGLSIGRTIAETHGGRLWVEPNSGRGVTFYVSLPAVGVNDERRA